MNIQWIAFALICALLFFRARPVRQNGAYINKETTTTINGFFICVVFMSHFSQYCEECYANEIGNLFKQLVVATFLFYSGYGCAVQYRAKGNAYLTSFPRRRILTTLMNFDVAVCVFIVTGLLLGRRYPLRQIVLSLGGWDAVGNSAWYIFVIILCYAAFWASFKFCGRFSNPMREAWFVALVAFLALALSRIKDQSFWYDTMMVFPAGVMYGLHREWFESFFAKRYWPSMAALALVVAVSTHLPFIGPRYLVSFNLKSICFALMVVMVTMKMEFRSPALRWCGEHLFPIYIYQRIPMIVFSTLHSAAFRDWRCWFYCVLSIVITVVIAQQYRRFQFT
ncbi:MAG: acyltransferase family protein [Kiritimatiellae bacterium]|nr:acyltransferase family protein [Kiritimatiellia bacterium]